MNRSTPVQLRESLEIANTLAKSGIRFVPIPVINEQDFEQKMFELTKKLERIEELTSRREIPKKVTRRKRNA